MNIGEKINEIKEFEDFEKYKIGERVNVLVEENEEFISGIYVDRNFHGGFLEYKIKLNEEIEFGDTLVCWYSTNEGKMQTRFE